MTTVAPRINLLEATRELLDAAIADPSQLAALLGASIADDWMGFPEALPHLRAALGEGPPSGWGTFLFLLAEPRTLVGMGGYKGEPGADGSVEIGYAVAPAFRARGIATAAARALISQAWRDARVAAITAHTLAQANASTRVLERLGFARVAERSDPNVGTVWQWSLQREAR